ncbi:helix-turn-helix transcriptional regulator [Methylobacter sp.]|uniref:helix-turn-helix transcriptional regulator n=1 Tax=Methylobacter sp. TaxID=2051955 RepID=UPI003DA6BBC5
MTISTHQKAERRYLPRRLADRAINDLYKTFSTPHCHSCLERTDDAVLLLDSERRIMYATSQADKIMSRFGMPFTLVQKFTLPPSHKDAFRFAAFVNGKNTEPGPLILLLTGENDQDLLLLTCFRLPEPLTANLHAARYMVALRDPNHYPVRQWHFFTSQFSLTPAEARLCRALADGLTLNDYCTIWRVRISTARSQLRDVFAKTATHGQSDLMRLIYLFTRV